ncbi:hypothetical protein PspLS_03960 [Pyricularia sp. CBS 133598]|nr:hypothetical protein PspLS_03960 [Pyricularia sp. CBS 133598]
MDFLTVGTNSTSLESYLSPSESTLKIAALGLLGAITLVTAMSIFGTKNSMPVEGKTILLTGGSDGMGRSVAVKLAAKGANVIIVARNLQRLEETVAAMKSAAKSPKTQRFHYISADVGRPGYAVALLEAATVWNGGQPPDIVWTVAGIAHPSLFADTPDAMRIARQAMDVNYWGTAELAHAVLRAWYNPSIPAPGPTAEPRHLIFTSTAAVMASIAGYGLYAPSKAALRCLADALSQEVLLYPDHPVKLHVVLPGTITSDAFEKEQQIKHPVTKVLEKDDPVQSPEEVAEASIKGLERGNYLVTVNWLGEALRWSMIGSSWRNNWVVDILGAWVAQIIWIFVLWDMRGVLVSHAKKHGRPLNQVKEGSVAG